MITIIHHADGRRETIDDGLPDPVQPPDEITVLKAEVARLEAVAAKLGERTGLTKTEAEALAKSAAVALTKG
jgi:hypothetical protein